MTILVQILEGGERYQNFDVDVAIKRGGEVGVVRDNPSIINRDPVDLVFPTTVRSVVEQIAFPVDARVRLESLWKTCNFHVELFQTT